MAIIIGIIGIFIVISIVIAIFEHLLENLGIYLVIIAIAVSIYYFKEQIWDIIPNIAPGIGIAIVSIILVIKIFNMLANAIQIRSRNKIELEKQRQKTEIIISENNREQRRHDNDLELKKELEQNCKYLGQMNSKRWLTQLSNYIHKEYNSSFEEITHNFASQMEEQYIKMQAEKWMKEFEEYIVQRPDGSTIHKMLDEVDCDALRITHITPNHKILKHYLEEGTKKLDEDLLPKFKKSIFGDYELYQPTLYLQHLYENKNQGIQIKKKNPEIIIDDNEEWADIE